MYTVAFYSPIIPYIIIWGALSIFVKYYINKYNIIKRRCVKLTLNKHLSIEMTEMLEYFLPLYSVSNIIFIY